MATKAKKYLDSYPPMKRKVPKGSVAIRGFFRLNITDPAGTIKGDSGWIENQVCNDGIQIFLCHLLGASAASQRPLYAALGTGTTPASNATALPGETQASKRATLSYTNSLSNTARFTGTFQSSDNWLAAATTLQNIGLFGVSTSAAGSIFCGKTYATSAVATNNNINFTYDVAFTT